MEILNQGLQEPINGFLLALKDVTETISPVAPAIAVITMGIGLFILWNKVRKFEDAEVANG